MAPDPPYPWGPALQHAASLSGGASHLSHSVNQPLSYKPYFSKLFPDFRALTEILFLSVIYAHRLDIISSCQVPWNQ